MTDTAALPVDRAAALAAVPGTAHAFFGRQGGVSVGIYTALNCGLGSRDDRAAVNENRERCRRALAGSRAATLVTVHQTHSADTVRVDRPWPPEAAPVADALVTDRPGVVLAVLTADCAPVLLADGEAGVIGAAHAGWKGARSGVIGSVVAAMTAIGARPERITAAIGPTIGPASYEVGPEFRARFLADDPALDRFFRPRPGTAKVLFDLPGYVATRLRAAGVGHIETIAADTLAEEARYFSHRRAVLRGEDDYGRQIAAIMLAG